MSIPLELQNAIYQAITNSTGNNKAVGLVMDDLYTSTCLDIFEATLADPSTETLTNDELRGLVDPIFSELATDFNEILEPYKIEVGKWDCSSLAKKVEAMQEEGL